MEKQKIKDDSYQKLEMINQWINNSDSKSSIVLGLVGIFFIIVFTNTSFINNILEIIKKISEHIIFSDVLYIMFFIVLVIFRIYGIWALIKVLVPTIKLKNVKIKSYLLFESIAQYSNYKEYKDEYLKVSDDDIIDDLLNQIYQNSIICNKKYISFTNGLRYFLFGFASPLIIYGLGLLIYL
jgi:hypothetical protein